MKKICLLLSMLMVFCMLGTTAFAAGTTDAAITLDVDKASVAIDEEFTLTVGFKGDSAGQPIYGTAKVVVTWDPEYIEFVSGSADDSTFTLQNATTYTESGLANNKITYSQKVLNTEDRPADDNVFGKITFKAIKEGSGSIWLDSTTSVYVNSATTTTTRVALAKDTTAAVAIGGGDEPTPPADVVLDEETFDEGASSFDVEEGATIKYGDKEVVAGANAKVYTFFAKASKALAAEAYGVTATIGGKAYKFPGAADVSETQNWAIRFVVPAGTFADGVAVDGIAAEAYYVD